MRASAVLASVVGCVAFAAIPSTGWGQVIPPPPPPGFVLTTGGLYVPAGAAAGSGTGAAAGTGMAVSAAPALLGPILGIELAFVGQEIGYAFRLWGLNKLEKRRSEVLAVAKKLLAKGDVKGAKWSMQIASQLAREWRRKREEADRGIVGTLLGIFRKRR